MFILLSMFLYFSRFFYTPILYTHYTQHMSSCGACQVHGRIFFMKVSLNQTTGPNVRSTNGFGYAAQMCTRSLEELGHEVSWRDPTADVEVNFIQPQHWYWSGPDYRIGYVPWESTTIPDGWLEPMNEVDEVWTPSPIIADWFVEAGVTTPVKVYEHGVEALWEPRLRSVSGRFRSFHHGAEGLRKGSDLAMAAQQKVLWNEYACIAFKCSVENFAVRGSHRVEIYPGRIKIDELVELYHRANLMVYPSWGEGFGLTPLQAMATGMPVLITQGWAPYEYLLEDYNLIKSELVESPADWQRIHPGKMFKPDFNDLCEKLRYQYDNREGLAEQAFELSKKVHEDYSWVDKTRDAFAHLV